MAESSPSSTPKTVFVVGAGASKEVGLPIGSELKKLIATALDIQVQRGIYSLSSGDHHIYEALRLTADQNPTQRDLLRSLQSACWKIRDAMPQASSIDNFLDVHSDDKHIELCGKLAIVRTILEAEANSTLFVDPMQSKQRINFESVESTWFNSFFQRLTENCKPSSLAERLSSVALIVFNYDRCIEHYLYYALQNFYPSLNAMIVGDLLRKIAIYHPYGTVGALPCFNQDDSSEYGATPDPAQLLKLSGQIKTFTEGTDEQSSEVNAIRSNMRTFDKLVFLGFAFHPLNIDLLLPNTGTISQQGRRPVFATAYEISDSDIAAICNQLASRHVSSAKDIKIHKNFTCGQLFQEHTRGLSFT
jgi:hypothetical protein